MHDERHADVGCTKDSAGKDVDTAPPSSTDAAVMGALPQLERICHSWTAQWRALAAMKTACCEFLVPGEPPGRPARTLTRRTGMTQPVTATLRVQAVRGDAQQGLVRCAHWPSAAVNGTAGAVRRQTSNGRCVKRRERLLRVAFLTEVRGGLRGIAYARHLLLFIYKSYQMYLRYRQG